MTTDHKSGRGGATSAETKLTHHGRAPDDHFGFVNTPVFRGSTILFSTLDELEDYASPYRYGRNDNPTARSVSTLITELEGAQGTVLAPSGVAAISAALLAVLETGDEVLVTDSCYEPTRTFCDGVLRRMGIATRYYDPRIGAGIAGLLTERTRAVFVESPGSLTFEVQDLPAITNAVSGKDIFVLVDNSWATPLYFRPLEHGADITIHSGTKMFTGHSDVLMGSASANERAWPRLARTHRQLGLCASPDDSYLVARGMRTLAIRMKEHEGRALDVAKWLKDQPEVMEVCHPALPDHPDHEIWKRDFTGAGSLFGMILKPAPRDAVAAMVDGFQLFGMGYSWGGYESLCLPNDPARIRTAVPWQAPGRLFRVHIGLEGVDDLKADMRAALDRYAAALA